MLPALLGCSPKGQSVFAMRWFRSHRFEVASLALFALACQFLLGFGHVHLDRFSGNSSKWVIAAPAGKVVAAPAGKVASDLPASPSQKDRSGLGEDFCAICASMHLAGAVVVPVPPTLPEVSFYKVLHWSFAATQVRSIDHIHFNARGPPTV
jgi:hypothetical protein